MNSLLVSRTGLTPLFLFFGRQPRVPATLHLPEESYDPTSVEFVASFNTRLQQARDRCREGQVRMIKAMDQHRDASVRFEKGALAWLDSSECPIPGDHHFKLPWAGPFKILDTSPSTATLELPSHWQLRSNVFHFNKLRPFRARPPSFGPSLPSPPSPIVRRGQTYYVVDRIVNHRRVGRKGRDGLRAFRLLQL